MDIIQLIGYIVSLITAIGGWLLGRHTHRSNAIQILMQTIENLSKQVTDYQTRIIQLQNEIIEVRKENAELKEGQRLMSKSLEEVKQENRELKDIMKKHNPPTPPSPFKS